MSVRDGCGRGSDEIAGRVQNYIISTYVSQRPLSRQAISRISLGSFTGAVDFVLQLIRLKSLGSELQQS